MAPFPTLSHTENSYTTNELANQAKTRVFDNFRAFPNERCTDNSLQA